MLFGQKKSENNKICKFVKTLNVKNIHGIYIYPEALRKSKKRYILYFRRNKKIRSIRKLKIIQVNILNEKVEDCEALYNLTFLKAKENIVFNVFCTSNKHYVYNNEPFYAAELFINVLEPLC